MRKLTEIEALAEKATPGPWLTGSIEDAGYEQYFVHDNKTGYGDDIIVDVDQDKSEYRENQKFIAATDPQTVLAMATTIRQLLFVCKTYEPEIKNKEMLFYIDKARKEWGIE